MGIFISWSKCGWNPPVEPMLLIFCFHWMCYIFFFLAADFFGSSFLGGGGGGLISSHNLVWFLLSSSWFPCSFLGSKGRGILSVTESNVLFQKKKKKKMSRKSCLNVAMAEVVLPVWFQISNLSTKFSVNYCYQCVNCYVFHVCYMYIIITAMPNGQWLYSCGECWWLWWWHSRLF